MSKTAPATLAQDAVRRLAVDAATNRAALDELLVRTARLRRRLAGMAILGRELDPSLSIDDVVQEVALQVVLSIRSYDPARGPLGPWLAGVTRNVVVKRSRASKGPAEHLVDAEALV